MRILSIDGGGYLGLATAAFLQAVEHDFQSFSKDRFELFCGTSTGAIIALGFAYGMTAVEVAKLYEDLGPRVFPPPGLIAKYLPKLRGVFAARHDNAPLREALTAAFGNTTLGDLRVSGKKVLVTAFSLTSGRPKVFKTDHAAHLTAHDRYLLRDIALASSAAPTFLPLVDLTDPITGAVERFCDGGVAANSPALLGYAEAVSSLARAPADVSLLSLATPRTDLSEPTSGRTKAEQNPNRGYLGWGLGERIITLALDSAAMLTDTALERVAQASGARYYRVRFQEPAGVGLDVVTPSATETLRHIGADRARNSEIRARIKPFYQD